jgi:hypothetical protein
MENILNFLSTSTVENFKKNQGLSRINIMKGKTGKLFFSTGCEIPGFVSTKGIPSKSPMISLCEGENGDQFFLLHEEQSGEVVASL